MIITRFEWHYYLTIPLSNKFKNNTLYHKFNEFIYFTRVSAINSWEWIGSSSSTHQVEIREFPSGVRTLNDGGCAGIKGSITLPASLTSVGLYTFGNGNRIWVTELIMKGNTPPTTRSAYCLSGLNGKKIYVPDEAIDTYKTTQYWSSYAGNIYPISEYPVE